MTTELPELDFQRFWRRLQQLGLNAYEARSYLVLIGHPRFKAIELAARAHVPRQKIYEVLDSLVEKGFAQVVQEKTKLFSAVEPSLAVPSVWANSLYSAASLPSSVSFCSVSASIFCSHASGCLASRAASDRLASRVPTVCSSSNKLFSSGRRRCST